MTVSDFRPISFCNVIYKIIAKVLENRLKIVLLEIISPNQSEFVPERLIFDIIVAYENMHTMHNRMKWIKDGFMALKLDMSNAYDRVEWSFLKAALNKMRFDEKWVDLIMRCVSTVSCSILINGVPLNKF